MKDFPIEPDVVMLAAMNKMVHLTISIQCETIMQSLQSATKLERLLDEMVDLGLIIRPSHEVTENGK